ncbi:MAG: FUSC family protein [Pseudonocardiaceae bacterium]
MSGTRSRLASWADRWAAVDPGLNRLTSAMRAMVGVGSGLGVEYLFAQLTSQAVLVPMLLGAVLAMMAAFGVTDATRAGKAITLLCLPLFMIVGMLAALAVDRVRLASLVTFVVVMFVAVWIRRFGPRFFIGGMVTFIGYFFSLFLGLKLAQLPGLLAVIGVAVAWAMLLNLVLMPVRNDRVLRRMVRAFEARARAVADAALDLLPATTDGRARAQLRRRMAGLNEAALMIDGQLGAPGAVGDGAAEVVRHALFDAELATGALAGAVRLLGTLDDPPATALNTQVEAVLVALRSDHWSTAETMARGLEAQTSPQTSSPGMVTVGEPALTPELLAHRIAAAVLNLAAAQRDWSAAQAPTYAAADRPEQDTAFEPAVQLLGGNLPGSAKTVAAMAEHSGHGWFSRMSLTTRQAIQVALATGLAIAVGDVLSGQRYYWAVLAAFIAFTGTATTAETMTKAFNRTLGTMVGLLAAIPVVALTGASVPVVLPVVLISIFFGFYLLQISYALMIFFITLVVGELYALIGTFTAQLMFLRLEETAVGGALGCAVALLVLPTHTRVAVAASRRDLLAALQTLLADLAGWLRSPDSPTDLAAQARALDAQLHQMQTITRPLTRPVQSAYSKKTRQQLLTYDGLAYHARRVARIAGACPPPGDQLAAGLARACDQLVILAQNLAPPAPRLRRTSLSTTGDLLTALHMVTGQRDRTGGPSHGSLARELGHVHDALIELAQTHEFVTDSDEPVSATHGQPLDSGPALAPAFPPDPGTLTNVVRGQVYGTGYVAGTAFVTLVDMNGQQRARTATDAGSYCLTAPAPGTYLLICTPQPDESTNEAGPHAGLISIGGRPVTHDVVLPPRTGPTPTNPTESDALAGGRQALSH